MKTGGYDLVVEMSETLPNKLALAYYYMGRFPKFAGSYVLPLKNAPAKLAPLLVIDYEVKPAVPTVDFIGRNRISLSISADALLSVLGFRLEMKVGFTVEASVIYDGASGHLMADLRDPKVTARINDERVSAKALDALNQILATVLREYLARETPFLDLSPFISYAVALPGAKVPFTLGFGDFKITDDILAVGVNALGRAGGSVRQVEDMTLGTDLAFAISEDAINRFVGFWWENGNVKKRIENSGENEVEDKLRRQLERHKTLAKIFNNLFSGFLIRIEGLAFRYETVIELDKPPRVNLRRGNRIVLDGELKFHFSIGLYFVYKVRSGWKKWKKRHEKIASWTKDLKIDYSAQAELFLDGAGNMTAKLNRLSVWFHGLPSVLGIFVNTFANLTAVHMLHNYPVLQLGSMPVSRQIPGTKLTLQVSPSLTTTDYEAYVRAGVRIRGLESYQPAPYIANRNPKSLETHVPGCRWLNLTKPRHRVPYYSLEEAHADGYDNCFYCIGDSER